MILKTLSVNNFRNIASADFVLSPGTNIISGNNAQGKTNLMEAVSVVVENGFRTNKAADMLPEREAVKGEITAEFSVDKYPDKINKLSCSITQKGINRKINDMSYKEALQLYPQLKVIVFVPEDLYLIKGNPEGRRELLDDTAHMMNKIHRNMTGNYYRALKQKNTFLTSCEQSLNIDDSRKIQLSIWNEELAKAGVNVLCGRLKYYNTLSKYTCEYYSELNNKNEILSMKYNHTVFDGIDTDFSDTERLLKIYLQKLESYVQKEIIVGHTLIGVHRDDVSFYINGRNARDFASQGQIRSIAVALRLAQAKMFREKWQEQPIIILDDVLSELDEFRREFILQHIVNSQVFITGCNNNDFISIGGALRWTAEKGKFIQNK